MCTKGLRKPVFISSFEADMSWLQGVFDQRKSLNTTQAGFIVAFAVLGGWFKQNHR